MLYLFIIIPQFNFAQEKKPKVVLVLSGGGAKGVAHIPLLQKLDSLHIVPDLIIGTSMGSIVGGLYAMGYSGDSIAKITKNANWNVLLGGSVSLKDVTIEEKSEFNRYMVELDIKKGKPVVNPYLMNDQNLREFISTLTYPVYNVNNFDNLCIPFRAMTTDVVNGREVILSSGNLATAMRASMSLPGIFKPIPYKNTLLVDGGVLDNFPTDVAASMGADIIIGSDVGGGMEPKDKLTGISTILFQISMLTSNLKDIANRERCNILIDHLPNLTYSTGDFEYSNEIYDEGKIATDKNLDALVLLSKQLSNYQQKERKFPPTVNEFILDTIIFKGISKGNFHLVEDRFNIKTSKKYTTSELLEGINRAMGTELFTQIIYEHFTDENGKVGLIIDAFEHSKNQVKGSLHFDSDRGFGVILNYTGRNILGDASRFITTLDVAQQPRFRIEYQKIFGTDKRWWWDSEIYGENLQQEIIIDGRSIDDVIEQSLQLNNQINKNFNALNSYIGFGFNYQYCELTPKNDPAFNTFALSEYHFNNIELELHYAFNNMNDVFYATNGITIFANLSRSLLHDVTVSYYGNSSPSVSGTTNGFTKSSIKFEKRIPFKSNLTGIVQLNGSFIFEDKLKSNQVSFNDYGYAEKYFIGGILPIPDKNSYDFPGLNQNELTVTQFMELEMAAQYMMSSNLYLTPHFNFASLGYGNFNEYIEDAFYPKGYWPKQTTPSLLMSAGAKISYNSIVGPINFDTSWINGINNVKLFISLGLSFNIAN